LGQAGKISLAHGLALERFSARCKPGTDARQK
jgi:hypothetical protein